MLEFLNGVLLRGSPPPAFLPALPLPGAPAPAFPLPGLPGITAQATGLDARALNATGTATWGLDVVRASSSSLSGSGVKVAVLDSGLDLNHPDFAGRSIQTRSFVLGPNGQFEDVQDMVGHGTHCAGTACGPKQSVGGVRYGIAYEAKLFVGKVIDNSGKGPEKSILAGIAWAMEQGCRVASLSLGLGWPDIQQGLLQGAIQIADIQMWVQDYEHIGQQAIQANVALIAAAGNDSDRRVGTVWPVAMPALASKFLAVGAVDRNMQIAPFSNAGGMPNFGGAVDLAGPGVDIYSSWSQTALPKPHFPPPGLFGRLDGTSMATPHVAGCAALIAQARPNWSAADIMNTLMGTARPLSLSSLDAGRGLVQAFQ
jgi:subtilisin family serine protease